MGTKKQDIQSEVQLQNTSETTFKLGIEQKHRNRATVKLENRDRIGIGVVEISDANRGEN